MMKNSIIILFMLVISISVSAQDFNRYEKKYFVSGPDTLPYRLLLPEGYDAGKQYPLVFFMHGAGERGSDNEKQLLHGGRLFLQEDTRKKFPAIVVFPQCAANSFWSNVTFNRDTAGKVMFQFPAEAPMTTSMKLAQGLLYELLRSYPVKKKQVYIGGLSMGGMGTFEMVSRNPSIFAAAVPICGGGNTTNVSKMSNVKWWIFHGAKDNIVPVTLSEQMNEALLAAGAKVKFTVYPEADHNSWDPAFEEPNLLSWLFSQHR